MYKNLSPCIKTGFFSYLSFSVFSTLLPKVLSPWRNSVKSTSPLPSLSNTSASRDHDVTKLKQMVLLGKFWQHLRLSWQGGCSGALEAREAPADSTCQSCQSPTCEILWQHCLAMMICISGVDIFLWYHKPFAQAFNLIWGKGRSLNNWGPFNPWLAVAHYLDYLDMIL